MAIGDLYSANNVVIGQAAVLFAPINTPLPTWSTTLSASFFADPFSLLPWTQRTIITGSITSFTLTFARPGQAPQTTSSLTIAGLTAAQIATALNLLSNVSGAGGVAYVSGVAGTWNVAFSEQVADGILTMTPTGGAGSSISAPIWLPCGATDQGWKFSTNKSTQAINIEEQSPPVGTTIQNQNVLIDGTLSEDITKTLALAYNGTVTVTAAATNVPGTTEVNPTDTVLQYAVAMLEQQWNAQPRIIYAPQWTQLSNVATDSRRAAAKRMYPVQFSTVCKPSQIRIINFDLTAL